MSVMSVMRIPMTFIMILKLSVVIMMINIVQLDDGHHADHHGADHKDNQMSDLHEFASFNVALIVILTQP